MKTRSSATSRIRTLPIVLALALNAMAPALSVVAPAASTPLAPLAAQPVRAAADPIHVNFTTEGCNLDAGDVLPASLICDDADYTPGNLGKEWNELDLVPHRLTTTLGEQDTATTDYSMGIAADYNEAGHPGYDVITAPILNDAKSDDSCSISAGSQQVINPGIGGTDQSIGRVLTIHQDRGTTCVFDWVQRLALGSHLFPGSSLHSNKTDQNFSSIGASDIPLPVNEILPQELSKDMSAEQGQEFTWEVEKEASPTELSFPETCDDSPEARSAEVEITITWTRSGPTGTGDTVITTHVYATNPAHRVITITPTDKIYEGAGQTTLLSQATGNAVDVAALSSDVLIFTHSFTYSGSATHFNDVATATYIDKITGIAVPGQTQADASADTVASDDPAENGTVVITDTESITGADLSFAVAAPSVGSFTNYTADTSTTGPVNWSSGSVTTSGSVTFTKTVTVDQPAITSGTLSDTATLTGDNQTVLDSASASVDITTDASVSLTIDKSIPTDALRSGESVTFDFDITGPNSFSDTASITFTYGGLTSKSTTLTGLEPGTYTVSEQSKANWADQQDQQAVIDLPDCEGTVSFDNQELPPDLRATKVADSDDPVNAGQDIGFTITVWADDDPGEGISKDVVLDDPLPAGQSLDWSIDPAYSGPGTCEIQGSVGAQTLHCEFGDLDPGDSASVHVTSGTAVADCETYKNIATVTASNHDTLYPEDSVTIQCPGLNIAKEAADPVIDAGETAQFEIILWNTGPGTALDVVLNDPLPGSNLVWTIVSDPSDSCDDPIVSNQLHCEFGDLGVSTKENSTARVTVAADVERPECADLDNTAFAEADNVDEIQASASIDVHCPLVEIEKTNDQSDPVLPGTEASYSLEVTVTDGPATDVLVVDTLPEGLDDPTDISNSGVWDGATRTITWDLGDLDDGTYELTYTAAVSLTAEHGDELTNVAVVTSTNSQCPDAESLEPECDDDSTVTVRVPELVIDKEADVELITRTLDSEGDVIDIDPEVVTWTLTYTLTNGPVTNAVITEPIPAGLTYVADSAVPDADFDAATNTLTWTFPTLTESGFVTFQTTVTEDAPTGTITNVATIESDETPLDDGEDSIRIVEEQELGGTGTPAASVPNTAMSGSSSGGSLATLLFGVLLIGSLGALAYANAAAVKRRR